MKQTCYGCSPGSSRRLILRNKIPFQCLPTWHRIRKWFRAQRRCDASSSKFIWLRAAQVFEQNVWTLWGNSSHWLTYHLENLFSCCNDRMLSGQGRSDTPLCSGELAGGSLFCSSSTRAGGQPAVKFISEKWKSLVPKNKVTDWEVLFLKSAATSS